MYEELKGFKKGDLVLVKNQWVKQVNAIYAEGRLAFQRVKGEPANAKPEDCRLLERTWEHFLGNRSLGSRSSISSDPLQRRTIFGTTPHMTCKGQSPSGPLSRSWS
jgi:hypothetical protein